jgi:hypothetical protein
MMSKQFNHRVSQKWVHFKNGLASIHRTPHVLCEPFCVIICILHPRAYTLHACFDGISPKPGVFDLLSL